MRRGAASAASLLLCVLLLAWPGGAQFQPLTPPDWSPFEPREDLASAGDLAGARRVLRFVQVSDAHVLDDDAPQPMRVGFLDPLGPPAEAAGRPQEEYTDEVLDAMIRTINGVHASDALDFVVNTGDNVDNALENELMRFLDNWEGRTTTVGPHSGMACLPDGQSESEDDDAHDVTDACTSLPESLAANNTPLAPGLPWFSAFGNHDGLIQGHVPREPSFQEVAAEYGRYFLDQREYVGMHFDAGGGCVADAPAGSVLDDNGHGFGFAGERLCDDDPDNDGYYAFTLAGVRFVVLDTVNDDFVTGNDQLAGQFNPQTTLGGDVVGGYAEGAVDPVQFEWLLDELGADPTRLVVVMSHHTVNSMFGSPAEGNCQGGQCLDDLLTEAGYKTGPDLVEALSQYPNAVAWFGGHTHQHRIEPKSVEDAPSPGFWNVETSSLIDLPQEARVVELWVTADGRKAFWALSSIGHDFEPSRTLAATDPQSDAVEATGTPLDRDVLLWFDLPAGVSLQPQPSLPRGLRVDLASPERVNGTHGAPGDDLRLTFQVTDTLLGGPVSGLNVSLDVRHLDADATGTVTDLQNATLSDDGAGRYSVTFTPTAQGTYFLDLRLRDPTGTFDALDRTLSLSVAEATSGDAPQEDSPGVGAASLLALLGLLAVAARRRY